jgi:3-deoxy-D-manno-octulosonic-acid transferase
MELGAGEVLLVDTIGELMRLYAVADLVFVGGSLVPVGGHNVLEPASLGVPVLFGPHMANFRDIAGLILSYGGARQVADGAGLAAACVELAADKGKRRELGDSGCRLVNEEGGATQRHLAAIAAILGEG